jgi:3-methyladenine DNA glycosylase AlkD
MPGTSTPSAAWDAARVAARLERTLRAAGDPVRAAQERRYLKSSLEHVGVTVPATRAIAKTAGPLDRAGLIELAELLWARPVHECRAAAVDLLEFHQDLLVPSDVGLLERMIREARTWALVDDLAASIVAPLVERHPALGTVLDRWAGDDDFWVRRAALLALLPALRAGGGDFARFGRYADAMLEEREFFIGKAIGWVLRDTSRKRPDLVFDWLWPRVERASAVTVREAIKHLSEAQRESILARRPSRRAPRTR